MTTTTPPKSQPTADDWIERARALSPRNEAFIDGRFVPAVSGRTFDDTQLKTTWIDLSGT